ncbi:MAG: glutamate-5-semialdehyde dehydrogenase [Bacillota bacterium]|jgi:glutamate-5-semialdehyde dehydrogenase|nr:glutamate-5-semialdehyde dehydrogenase [Bacillota bacterium]HOB90440.1 glutamate-5-semialdehyde dehydrogenase [Bacillota bacterium]HPZ53820.1 glutamate-5-semialdehyde dehydrogenase [Bacillota bacterium]HQD17329.1 glutamate-5-semialdehyde dehydrogenase [Bacillota bacterium]
MYTSDVACEVRKKAEMAKRAARALRNLSRDTKDAALRAMAQALEDNENAILESNSIDMANGEKKGLGDALLDRLKLNHARIMAMAEGLRELANLEDPVGTVSELTRRPNGLLVGKMRVPLGVIGFVFESRPNVTADTSGLCIKSGNAIIMRGGSEAYNSNRILTKLLADAAVSCGIPQGAIQLVESTDREGVRALATSDDLIDLMIVRGGEQLVRAVSEYATVPLIKHGKGLCHVYLDKDADVAKAVEIAFNAKVDRPGVCNAMETLLVHKDIAQACLPQLVARLCESGVELVGCPRTVDLLKDHCDIKLANDSDWDAEYLALKLSIKIVDSYEEAVDHICSYGSGHTEAIVTENHSLAMQFLDDVDASVVLVNASTRFNDGFQLGLGAELGISTQKLHARGPMGLKELTCEKFVVLGQGQVREA